MRAAGGFRRQQPQRRTINRLIPILLLLTFASGAGSTALAQSGPTLNVEVGFQGTFAEGQTTPVGVEIDHEGVPIDGQLVVRQTWRPLMDAPRTIEARRAVTLGPKARLRYVFHLPLYAEPPPGGESPEISVELLSNGQSLARRTVALENARRSKLILMASQSGYLQELPTGEATLQLNGDELPDDWRAYDGVKRLYVGRLDVPGLGSGQRRAIRRWVASGGELIVLSGENAFRHDAGWLVDLVPFRVESVESLSAFKARAALGEPRGEVVYAEQGHPLLTRWRVGRGEVWFSALSLTRNGATQDEVWSRLTSGRTEQARPFERGADLFRRMPLRYPDKMILAGVFAVYLLGIGLSMLWALRRTPWSSGGRADASAATSDDDPAGRAGPNRLWVGMVLWIGLTAAFVVGYGSQSGFSERVQGFETGILWGSSRAELMHVSTGHSAIAKRRLRPEWTLPDRTAVTPLQNTDVAITDSGTVVAPLAGTLPAKRIYDVALESVRPLDVRVEPRDDSAVRPDQLRVYNESHFDLRESIVWQRGAYYAGPSAPIAPGEQASVDLSDAASAAQPWFPGNGRTGGFRPQAKGAVFDAVDRRLRERGDPWALLAWVRESGVAVHANEYRQTWRLLVVTPW